MAVLLNENSRVLIQGFGGAGQREAANSLAFGTKVVCGVTPGRGGQIMKNVPVLNTVREGVEQYEANGSLIRDLKFLIEQKYFWAINIDFRKRKNNYLFWYVSEEKLEPRLGERFNEPGADLEDKLGIAKMVSELYQFILKLNKNELSLNVAEFLILYPKFRGIIKRIQTLW